MVKCWIGHLRRLARRAPLLAVIGWLAAAGLGTAHAQTLGGQNEASATIIGSWRLHGAKPPMTITFKPNGTYDAVTSSGLRTGRWALTSDGEITTWADDGRPKRVNGFALNDEALVIIDERGRFHKHRRVSR